MQLHNQRNCNEIEKKKKRKNLLKTRKKTNRTHRYRRFERKGNPRYGKKGLRGVANK